MPESSDGSTGATSSPDRDGVRVLDKAGAILDLLVSRGGRADALEISGALGFSRTTTYRLLKALQKLELVSRTASGSYRLGGRLIALGALARSTYDLRAESRPMVEQLARETGHTTYLFVPGRSEAICLLRASGRDIEVLAVAENGSLPYNAGGGPRAILAALPDSEILNRLRTGPLPRFTEATITTFEELMRDVQETRRRGYALSWEDVTPGVAAVGVAVMEADGTVAGSLSVAGLKHEFDDGAIAAYVRALSTAAKAVSAQIGHAGVPPI